MNDFENKDLCSNSNSTDVAGFDIELDIEKAKLVEIEIDSDVLLSVGRS